MLGAIAGDIIGSRFERAPIKHKDFELFHRDSVFTDDTVHTVALADSLLQKVPYQIKLREYFSLYPNAGYGERFMGWAESKSPAPYGSFGNGSAMRVSPVAWWFDSLDEVIEQAKNSAEITHNHPEAVRGAQSVAAAIFLARNGADKVLIRDYIEAAFKYDLSTTTDANRPGYTFDATCQGSVPQAIRAFIDAADFEDAVRNAISLGGDSDTQACIAGSIAEAYYGVLPGWIVDETMQRLDERLLAVWSAFANRVKHP